jgi:hypothetical protein
MNHHCPFAKRAMKPKGPATPVSSVTSTPSRVDRSRWVRGAIKIAIPKSSPGSVRYPGELLALEEQCLLDTPMPLQTYTSVGLYSGCILSEKVAVIRCPGWSSESSHLAIGRISASVAGLRTGAVRRLERRRAEIDRPVHQASTNSFPALCPFTVGWPAARLS